MSSKKRALWGGTAGCGRWEAGLVELLLVVGQNTVGRSKGTGWHVPPAGACSGRAALGSGTRKGRCESLRSRTWCEGKLPSGGGREGASVETLHFSSLHVLGFSINFPFVISHHEEGGGMAPWGAADVGNCLCLTGGRGAMSRGCGEACTAPRGAAGGSQHLVRAVWC